jgi:hypothetical protein
MAYEQRGKIILQYLPLDMHNPLTHTYYLEDLVYISKINEILAMQGLLIFGACIALIATPTLAQLDSTRKFLLICAVS